MTNVDPPIPGNVAAFLESNAHVAVHDFKCFDKLPDWHRCSARKTFHARNVAAEIWVRNLVVVTGGLSPPLLARITIFVLFCEIIMADPAWTCLPVAVIAFAVASFFLLTIISRAMSILKSRATAPKCCHKPINMEHSWQP